MRSLLKPVASIMTDAIKISLNVEEKAELTFSPQIGDYRCTSAMKLYNKHKKTGSFGCATNKDLALKIISGIPPNEYIDKVEATPMKRNPNYSFHP